MSKNGTGFVVDNHSEEKKHENDVSFDPHNSWAKRPSVDLADSLMSADASNNSDVGSQPLETVEGTENDEDLRLEAAWAQAEEEYNTGYRNGSSLSKPLFDSDESCHVSPLMACSSNTASPTDNKPHHLIQGRMSNVSLTTQSKQEITANAVGLIQQPAIRPSFLQRYRTFLQKHEPSLDILERIMERFVFYRYLFKHDHRGISIELYYAAWNIIRWINDVVLVGWGEGMGMTVGRREEWLGKTALETSTRTNTWTQSFHGWALSRMHIVVPVLRSLLTATTCVYPALEAWSRRPVSYRPTIDGTILPHNDSSQQPEDWNYATTTDPSPRTRRLQWKIRESRAADLSYRIEKIRFVSRLALLSIAWWTRFRCKSLYNSESDNDHCKERAAALPSLLRRGGELDPSEDLLPLYEADAEAAVAQYVGKRTGRRSIPTSSMASATVSSTNKATKGRSFLRYLAEQASAKHNVLYFHAVGELLHILRPLYWSRSECIHWKHRASSSNLPHDSKTARGSSTFSTKIWKAWLVSLVMDVVSDELLDITTGCKSRQASSKGIQRRGSLFSRSTTRHSPYSPLPSVQQSEQEELEWRRSRRSLYLLRSPVYSAVTLPVVTILTKLLTMVPSFGLGRWASEYILDMMGYWNEHRFMLE
ncbi:hypothetical protein HJC23_009027 [Cyclotella cryptica]|uniref:Peroxisomal membrane protein PEX16 n=1 Tax=Cyclotella cryptica TaxID=29204 RepID=A0ABD3RAC3_9STRA